MITTNFDALIEVAYLSLYGTDIATAAGTLLKIHGSIQSIENGMLVAADRRAMKADIFSVAAGTPISGVGGTLAELADLLLGRDLLVMGYSFSDSFDVTPALRSATPRSATVIEYAVDLLAEVATLTSLPNFAEIGDEWRPRGVVLRLLRGDPMTLVPSRLGRRFAECSPPGRSQLLPNYNSDQLRYLIARLLQIQNFSLVSNRLFHTLSQDARDLEIGTRATYRFAHTLPDWDQIVPLEARLMNLDASGDIRLRAVVLLLDVRSFIGPGSEFLKQFAAFKRLLACEALLDRDRVLFLAKARNCFANFLMNRGRPHWALGFAEASLKGRTQFGAPTDIFYAEHACCLALVLSQQLAPLAGRLVNYRRYARAIGDQTSALCVQMIEGLYLLESGEVAEGLRCLEQAKKLYTVDAEDTQVDPELDLYILEARVRLSGWTELALRELAAVTEYVHNHHYSYYGPVVAAIYDASKGHTLCKAYDRLTRAHLHRARLAC